MPLRSSPKTRLKNSQIELIERPVKRRCTIDISSAQDPRDLLIEDDEVSLKLLRKLTTPQKPIKKHSFCYPLNDMVGFKLDFNSDIDSVWEEDLGQGDELFGRDNDNMFF